MASATRAVPRCSMSAKGMFVVIGESPHGRRRIPSAPWPKCHEVGNRPIGRNLPVNRNAAVGYDPAAYQTSTTPAGSAACRGERVNPTGNRACNSPSITVAFFRSYVLSWRMLDERVAKVTRR